MFFVSISWPFRLWSCTTKKCKSCKKMQNPHIKCKSCQKMQNLSKKSIFAYIKIVQNYMLPELKKCFRFFWISKIFRFSIFRKFSKISEFSESMSFWKFLKFVEPFITFVICVSLFHPDWMHAMVSTRPELLFLPLVIQNGQVFMILERFKVTCKKMQILQKNVKSSH